MPDATPTKGSLRLVLGGSRSGKSRFAEELAGSLGRPVVYMATCRTAGMDAEMRGRVRRHRVQRPAAWETIEDCFDLRKVAEATAGKVLLMDCLTLWLANAAEGSPGADAVLQELEEGLEALAAYGVHTVIVSNELGMGLVPMTPETRAYRDLVGWANQLVARKASEAYFLVAGLPITLKRDGQPCGPNMAEI